MIHLLQAPQAPSLALPGLASREAPRAAFGRRRVELDLGPVAAGALVLVTLSLGLKDDRWRWQATARPPGGEPVRLPAFGHLDGSAPAARSSALLRIRDDWLECRAPLPSLRLEIDVDATADWRERPHLLCVSVRTRPRAAGLPTTVGPSRAPRPPITQRQFPRALAARICSPVCMAMLGDGLRELVQQPPQFAATLIDRAYDPRFDLYGVWPQNVWAASGQRWLAGAVALADWDEACRWLRTAGPLACSLGWGAGQLRDAALPASAGHFMVLTAADRGRCEVLDPAAADADGVPRRYDSGQFTRAWLLRHGVAYFRLPA